MENNQANEALITLKNGRKVLKEDSNLQPTYRWYSILALLRNEQLYEAKKELTTFIKNGYAFQSENAKKLAENLKGYS